MKNVKSEMKKEKCELFKIEGKTRENLANQKCKNLVYLSNHIDWLCQNLYSFSFNFEEIKITSTRF